MLNKDLKPLAACAIALAMCFATESSLAQDQGVGANRPFSNQPTRRGEITGGGRAPVAPPARAQAAPRRAPIGLGANEASQPTPLLPPDDPELTSRPPQSPAGMLWTVISSLAVVLGLFFAVAMLGRRGGVGGPTMLPTEAFEVLGRAPLNGRQHAQVVRFGDKLILLSVSPNGVDALAEVTAEEEVERIAALCQQERPDSVTQTFRQVLTQFSREPTPDGFVGEESPTESQSSSSSEFERMA